MSDRDEALIAAVRDASGGEWIDAAQVHRQLGPDAEMSPAAVARALPALARAGHFDVIEQDGSKRYRAEVRAVVVYDADGREAGRLLLWRTREGMLLDASQLVEMLPAVGWRLRLGDRDVRTVRAACDDALWHGATR